MIDDKKEYEIGNTYNCGCKKNIYNIHNLFMISATCRSIFFLFLLKRTYFADIKKMVKFWNKLFRLANINPGPFCGSTFLVFNMCDNICLRNFKYNVTCFMKKCK